MKSFKYETQTIRVSRFGGGLTRWEKENFGWCYDLSGSLTKGAVDKKTGEQRSTKVYKIYDFHRPSNFTSNPLFNVVEWLYRFFDLIQELLFIFAPVLFIAAAVVFFLGFPDLLNIVLIVYGACVGGTVLLSVLGRLIGTVFGIFKKNQAKMNFLKSRNEDVAISVREVPLWGLLSKFDNYCLGYFPFKEWTTTIAKLENNFKQVNKAIKDEVDDFIRNPERLPNPDNIPTPYMHAAEGSKRAYTLYARLNPYTKNGFFLLFQGLVRILHPLVYLALFLLIFSLISVFADLYLPVEVYVIGFAILGLWLMSDLLALVVRKAFRLDAKSLGLSTEEREKAKEGDFDATHPHFIGKDNRACDDVKN